MLLKKSFDDRNTFKEKGKVLFEQEFATRAFEKRLAKVFVLYFKTILVVLTFSQPVLNTLKYKCMEYSSDMES